MKWRRFVYIYINNRLRFTIISKLFTHVVYMHNSVTFIVLSECLQLIDPFAL